MRLFGSLQTRRNLAILTTTSLCFSTRIAPTTAAMATTTSSKVIDSHLHVWANTVEAASGYPYVQEPPESLKDTASIAELIQQMDANGVDGALIVQPINHKYDHSYVVKAMKEHSDRFKGMMLHDPSLDAEQAVSRLEDLSLQGFVGVRFNPYLWPPAESKGEQKTWEPMSQDAGLAVYKRCAELRMPVGVMCFQGLDLHYDDILRLLDKSPETVLVLDHFGFTLLSNDENFEKLLALAKHPSVIVKISALFRLDDEPPYQRVREERFLPLLEAFGADRLMFGSDFPFVLEQPEGYGTVKLVSSWIDDKDDRKAVLGGTAERIFGPWGGLPKQATSEL